MLIQTKFDIGASVIVNLDGSYARGTVQALLFRLNKDDDVSHINYEVGVPTTLFAVGKKRTDANATSTFLRGTTEREETLLKNFELYKLCESQLTTDQSKQPQDKRDKLILWHMSLIGRKPIKEANNGEREKTD